jgi:hypothetical protein
MFAPYCFATVTVHMSAMKVYECQETLTARGYFDIEAGCAARCVPCKAHSSYCTRVSAATVADDKCAR